MKSPGLTGELRGKLKDLNMGEEGGIPSVEVKFVEIGRNIGGESGSLDQY